ncbi:hypothetical protein HY409_04050 [Candidatus Gottesmanbacteria bacterium]|nr:hypothetical protein [Candidatus Gottesmanbacteria bacterium]
MFTRPKPIKPFKTLDEEAEFWDTHDISELGKVPLMKLPLIEPEKEEVLSVRVQRSVKEQLTNIARKKGIGATTLARMWILERLGVGA